MTMENQPPLEGGQYELPTYESEFTAQGDVNQPAEQPAQQPAMTDADIARIKAEAQAEAANRLAMELAQKQMQMQYQQQPAQQQPQQYTGEQLVQLINENPGKGLEQIIAIAEQRAADKLNQKIAELEQQQQTNQIVSQFYAEFPDLANDKHLVAAEFDMLANRARQQGQYIDQIALMRQAAQSVKSRFSGAPAQGAAPKQYPLNPQVGAPAPQGQGQGLTPETIKSMSDAQFKQYIDQRMHQKYQ